MYLTPLDYDVHIDRAVSVMLLCLCMGVERAEAVSSKVCSRAVYLRVDRCARNAKPTCLFLESVDGGDVCCVYVCGRFIIHASTRVYVDVERNDMTRDVVHDMTRDVVHDMTRDVVHDMTRDVVHVTYLA